jgi:uncharacterized protein (DUF1330 family)
MTVYAIAQSRINDPAAMEKYVAAAGPTLKAHDVKLLALDETPAVIEGTLDYARTVIIEFNDANAFHAWYDSPEYQAVRELRRNAAVGRFILVNGL